MNEELFLYSLGLFLIVLVLSLVFKRRWKAPYDRKAISSSTLALIATSLSIFYFRINWSDIPSMNSQHKVVVAIVIVLTANALIQVLFWIGFTFIRQRGWVKMPRFLFDIFSFIIILGVLLYTVQYVFDRELTGILVTSTVVSAIIGLALQETLSNLFSGISLQIETPFSIDDWVNLGGFEGKVVSQNWRTVTLLTRENHRVSLTNRFVAEDKIVNFSRPTRKQIHNFYIELDYSHPPNRVKRVLRQLLSEIDEVELDENHGAFVLDYMESGIKYCLRYWLYDYADILHIQDVVLSRLWYTLKRNDIKIPYPTREIQMKVLDEDEPAHEELNEEKILHFLTALEWLSEMEDEKIQSLVKECRIELYAKDDLIVQQGDQGDSMFIIVDGEIRVMVKSESGSKMDIVIAQKGPGEFFGEMSLLTGEPRTASIRAQNDCRVLVIDKDAFSTLIISDEKILSQFVNVLVKCKSGIADAIESERKNQHITKASAHRIILTKILTYFKI